MKVDSVTEVDNGCVKVILDDAGSTPKAILRMVENVNLPITS